MEPRRAISDLIPPGAHRPWRSSPTLRRKRRSNEAKPCLGLAPSWPPPPHGVHREVEVEKKVQEVEMKDAEEEKEEKSGAIDNHSTASRFVVALGNSSWSDLPSPSSWNIDILIDSIKQLILFLSRPYVGHVGRILRADIILKIFMSAPPKAFTFAHSSRQLAYVDAINGHKLQLGHANHAWLCLDLLDVLCQIAEAGYAGSVRAMLEYPLKYCPEVLLLAMTLYNLLQSEVSLAVFPMIMKNAGGVGMILYLWQVNPILVLRGFVDPAGLDPDCMT
ncbi:hypothetical protein NL676_030026 [Syzygium grande]|nr:hypothetical protein NL676_030026 [Syzygium grande]